MSDQGDNEDYHAKLLSVFDQWEAQCTQAETEQGEHAVLAWKIDKTVRANAKTVKVLPGLKATILQWGKKGEPAFPTVVQVSCKELRRAIAATRQLLKEQK